MKTWVVVQVITVWKHESKSKPVMAFGSSLYSKIIFVMWEVHWINLICTQILMRFTAFFTKVVSEPFTRNWAWAVMWRNTYFVILKKELMHWNGFFLIIFNILHLLEQFVLKKRIWSRWSAQVWGTLVANGSCFWKELWLHTDLKVSLCSNRYATSIKVQSALLKLWQTILKESMCFE